VFCWILDSGLRALVFRESSFVEQALSPDPRDLLGRVLLVCLVTLLGIYAIAALGKAKQAVRAAELARAEADQVFNSMAHAVGVIDRPGEEDLAEQRLVTWIRDLQDLLEDVRHRHRDDLQLISNLLDLQCETIRDERSLRALKECRGRIRAITLVYQRLLESEGWSRVDFADCLGRQLARLFQTYDGSLGAITSRICVEQARLEIHMAIPCGLIVNELVSNSLRHAFPEGRDGEISIEVSRGPKGEHRLVVGDNGVGFPDDLDFRQT
ncbi:unnamed protein product, partial [marine sediment metagenome]